MAENISDQSETSQSRYSYDAFISHATADKEKADSIVAALEERNVRCWIAPRDMRPGIEYGAEIINGIKKSRTLVVLLSHTSVTSRHVRAEVERAVTLGHTVYPVRLEDVELGDALEFFLSIRQRIDVFDDPANRNLKILADAISSNAAPEHVAMKTAQPSWTKWAIPTAIAGGVLFALSLVYQFFSTEMAVRQIERQTQEAIASANEQYIGLTRSAKPDLKKLKFTTQEWGSGHFQVVIDGSDANVHQYDVRAYFEVDGERGNRGSGSFTTDGSFERVEFIVEDTNNEEIARRDVTDTVRQSLGDHIANAIRSQAKNNDFWECSIGGCQFSNGRHVSLCSPMIKGIAVRAGSSGRFQELPLNCETAQDVSGFAGIQGVCYNYNDFPFTLDPKTPLEFQVTLSTGQNTVFSVSLTPDYLRYVLRDQMETPSFDHWIELEPVASKNPKGPAPLALLAYEPDRVTVGGFRLVSGLQGCTKQGQGVVTDNGWLVDEDQKGLVRQGRQLNFGPVNQSIRGEDAKALVSGSREIAIAAEWKNGERKGPYWYRVDPRDAVRLAALREEPQVKCEGSRYSRNGQWVCAPTSPIGWVGAKRVAFGATGDNLSVVYDINFTAEEFLTQECAYNQTECKPFLFQIPDDWNNVFYEVTDREGKTSTLERVVIQR